MFSFDLYSLSLQSTVSLVLSVNECPYSPAHLFFTYELLIFFGCFFISIKNINFHCEQTCYISEFRAFD